MQQAAQDKAASKQEGQPGQGGPAAGEGKKCRCAMLLLLAAVVLAIAYALPPEPNAANPAMERYQFIFLFSSEQAARVAVEADQPRIFCAASYQPEGGSIESMVGCEDKASSFDGFPHRYTVTVDCIRGGERGGQERTVRTLDTDARFVIVKVACGGAEGQPAQGPGPPSLPALPVQSPGGPSSVATAGSKDGSTLRLHPLAGHWTPIQG